jgi:hypothetical protein
MLKRISEAINPAPQAEAEEPLHGDQADGKSSVGQIVERFERLLPKSDKEVSIVLQRLTRAGYRNEHAVKIFYGCQGGLPASAVRHGGGDRNGQPGPVFCVFDGAGRRVSGARLLAGEENR